MKKRVIYSGFNDERQFSVDYLKERHGWEPVFICAAVHSRKWAEENYPDALFQESMAIRQAYFDYSRIGPPVPLDAKIIGALSNYQLSCLSMLEDTTGWNFSFAERCRFYYDILKYWNTVINNLKPDIYICFGQPCMIEDYSLYLLCKHYFKIPVLYISPIPFFEKNYHPVCYSKEDMSSSFKHIYDSGQYYSLHTDVRDYLNRLRSDGGLTPTYIARTHKKQKDFVRFQYKEFVELLLKMPLKMLSGRMSKRGILAYKCNRKPFESPKSKFSQFGLFWFIDRLRRQNRKLKRIYHSFTEKPDLSRKYLYFASSYQPEASTSPNAGIFEDQLLALDILSACIPKDWVIYFKEHPGTFLPFPHKGSLRRNYYYYKKIASYNNVVMIPSEGVADTFQLIDNSQAVASISGTATWEASVRGKPSLFFGSVWYQGCKSIFKIESYQDAVDAMDKIEKGYVPDQKDIERYASAIQQVSVKGMIRRDFREKIKKCPDPKFEMERIAKALYEAYELHYRPMEAKSIESPLNV